MATMYYDKDADLAIVRSKKVGVIGSARRATRMP